MNGTSRDAARDSASGVGAISGSSSAGPNEARGSHVAAMLGAHWDGVLRRQASVEAYIVGGSASGSFFISPQERDMFAILGDSVRYELLNDHNNMRTRDRTLTPTRSHSTGSKRSDRLVFLDKGAANSSPDFRRPARHINARRFFSIACVLPVATPCIPVCEISTHPHFFPVHRFPR